MQSQLTDLHGKEAVAKKYKIADAVPKVETYISNAVELYESNEDFFHW